MKPESFVTVDPEVMYRDLAGEAVLLNLRSGVYYGLDAVGSRLWTFLCETSKVADIQERLVQEFDVPADRAWKDLNDFLQELEEKGLIRIDG